MRTQLGVLETVGKLECATHQLTACMECICSVDTTETINREYRNILVASLTQPSSQTCGVYSYQFGLSRPARTAYSRCPDVVVFGPVWYHQV